MELEKYSGLSNGDTVAYTWTVDEDLAKMLKCKIKCKDGSFSVSDLQKAETFDLFSQLEVEFTGTAPQGKVSLTYTGSELRTNAFHCDKSSGLSNGDTITVSISDSNVELLSEQLGKVPESLEKQYTVQGLNSYVRKASEIDETALAEMQKQASDEYISHAAQWKEDKKLENLSYLGNYLLTSKDGAGNYLYLVYKASIRNYYADSQQTYDQVNEVYWYTRFENLMVNGDGKTEVDVRDYSTPYDSVYFDTSGNDSYRAKRWSYYGYKTLEELYKDVAASKLDDYTCEDSINEAAPSAGSAAETKNQEHTAKAEEEWIFPDSNTVLLTKSDLEALSAEECKIARNEIYARHGRKFNDAFLQSYFESCEWYQGTVEADSFNEQELNETELANRNLIAEYEAEKGYK
ncbi:MAG: YARHG domain-containing protein [Clostridium sp.]